MSLGRRRLEMSTESPGREELIFVLSLCTMYSEDALRRMSDKELQDLDRRTRGGE